MHSQRSGSCPTCGGTLTATEVVDAVTRKEAQKAKQARERRMESSLRAWEAVRVRNLGWALCAAAVAGVLVWLLAAPLHAVSVAALVALVGICVVVQLYALTGAQYAALPYARDQGGHRCIFCGHRGVHEVQGLFGAHVHCSWCQTQLYQGRTRRPTRSVNAA